MLSYLTSPLQREEPDMPPQSSSVDSPNTASNSSAPCGVRRCRVAGTASRRSQGWPASARRACEKRIPKTGGKVRAFGIATTVDRVVTGRVEVGARAVLRGATVSGEACTGHDRGPCVGSTRWSSAAANDGSSEGASPRHVRRATRPAPEGACPPTRSQKSCNNARCRLIRLVIVLSRPQLAQLAACKT